MRVPVTSSVQVIVTRLVMEVIAVAHVLAWVVVVVTGIVPGSLNPRLAIVVVAVRPVAETAMRSV